MHNDSRLTKAGADLVDEFTAIDWLNANTSDRFSFFGVEIELLQIDQSRLGAELQRRGKAQRLEQGRRESYKTKFSNAGVGEMGLKA